jgi:hypothetical protein
MWPFMIRQFDPAFWFGGQLLDRSVVKVAKTDVELIQAVFVHIGVVLFG